MLSPIFKLSTKDILEVKVMTASRLDTPQLRNQVWLLVKQRKLNSLEDGATIQIPKTGKQYKLCIDSSNNVTVKRASEFLNERVSGFKKLRHSISDKLGFSTTAKLTKIFNDGNVQQVFNWLDEYRITGSTSSSITDSTSSSINEETDSIVSSSNESIAASIREYFTESESESESDAAEDVEADSYPLLTSYKRITRTRFDNESRLDTNTERARSKKRVIQFAADAEVRTFIKVDREEYDDVPSVVQEYDDVPSTVQRKGYNNENAADDLKTIFRAHNKGLTPRRLIGPIDLA